MAATTTDAVTIRMVVPFQSLSSLPFQRLKDRESRTHENWLASDSVMAIR
jgi:hypothetical protein